MFDSEPKRKEGEPIEAIVPEAINVTTSEARGGSEPGPSGRLPAWLPSSRAAFVGLIVLGAAEVGLLIVIVALWGTCS